MSVLAHIMGIDVPAALATISGVAELKRGLYTQDQLQRPALYYFMDRLRLQGSTNQHMHGSLLVTVGCWVDIRQGNYSEFDRLLEAVAVAMFAPASNPNWWSKTRALPEDEWVIWEPQDSEEVGGFWLPFSIVYDHVRTDP